ncbi:MAG: UDP-3-O-[3-hydroxymyristoyl] N-acetylglucosamine deacetylase [Chlamydiota bacterium]|jgi:UDP-3-O-[3-hydroxymyristoyl] N-acetylglucosamine deacetylase
MSGFQKTLKKWATASGIGLFTGETCMVRIGPAPVNQGIVFARVDLPHSPLISARLDNVKETPRSTRLGTEAASVVLVEHLLSALYAYGIDNATVEVSGPELPAGDGSAEMYVHLIEQAGIEVQDEIAVVGFLKQPVYWSEGDVHLIALPAPELRLSYTMHYPHSPLLRSQYYSFSVSPLRYRQDIAPCRTFSLYEEIMPYVEKGLVKGGGLDNGLVIQGDRILNPGGARFDDEMVRHKILDLLGDLSLIGIRFRGHVIAVRSGHFSNVAFARVLFEALTAEAFV